MKNQVFKPDGSPDTLAVIVRMMVPFMGAAFCWALLSPDELNVSETLRSIIASHQWVLILGLAINICVLIYTLTVIVLAAREMKKSVHHINK